MTIVDMMLPLMGLSSSRSSDPGQARTEEKSMEMDAVDEFIAAQAAKNTCYANNTASNLFHRFLRSEGDSRQMEKIPPAELGMIMCHFFINARKLDGTQFEPDSLSTTFRSLQRYLYLKKYPVNIVTDGSFEKCRNTLAAKRKELTTVHGLGNKPNATRELSEEEVDRLFEERYFSTATAQSLVNGIWWWIRSNTGQIDLGLARIDLTSFGQFLQTTVNLSLY